MAIGCFKLTGCEHWPVVQKKQSGVKNLETENFRKSIEIFTKQQRICTIRERFLQWVVFLQMSLKGPLMIFVNSLETLENLS